jgi:UDP-glucose 4-epimerase
MARPVGHGEGGRDRLRPLRHQRDHPFAPHDLSELRKDAAAVVRRYVPSYESEYHRLGWSMLPTIDRVYVNERARSRLGWQPRYDFSSVIGCLRACKDFRSPLAVAVGSKGYHRR